MPTENDVSIRASLEAAFAGDADTTQSDTSTVDTSAPPLDAKPDATKPGASAGSDQAKAPAKTDVTPAQKAGTDAAKPKRIEPPVRWTADEKEAWEKMTEGLDEAQAESIRKIQGILVGRNKTMEGEFTRSMQSVAADRAFKAQLDQVLAPRRDAWAKSGMNDAQAIAQLFDGLDHSTRDPAGFATWILQQRGVNPLQYAASLIQQAGYTVARAGQAQQQGQQGEDEVQLHPAVQRHLDSVRAENAQLRQQLGGVQGHVQQFTQQITQRQQQEQNQLSQQVGGEVRAFETATDENGAPKHPFFSDVRGDMVKLIDAGIADDLADAYDKAVYAKPELRAKMFENERIRTRREYEEKLAADAKKSRGAAGGLAPTGAGNGTLNAGSDDAEPGSIREALEQSLRSMQSGSRRV